MATADTVDFDSVEARVGVDSVRCTAESVGIISLDDDVAQTISDEITFRLKMMVQESSKFYRHAKRQRLTTDDFDRALKQCNLEPLYGFRAGEFIPFRYASGGGREVHFLDDPEVELNDIIGTPLPKLPVDVSIKAHWLAVEGNQPAVPENPPPAVLEELKRDAEQNKLGKPSEGGNPPSLLVALGLTQKLKDKGGEGEGEKEGDKAKDNKRKSEKLLLEGKVKEYVTHEMSTEQQLYYKEVTNACVGGDEQKRNEALQSLSQDTGLNQMLPRFSAFIAEGVKLSTVQKKPQMLVYLMKMVKALLENTSLYLEKYLHELVPAVITCLINKQLSHPGQMANQLQWGLREQAAKIMGQICRMFNSVTNNVQCRVTRMVWEVLMDEKSLLSQHYGAIAFLCDLGVEVSKVLLLPYLKAEGELLQKAASQPTGTAERQAGDKLQALILRYIPPLLVSARPPPDTVDEYKEEYGLLGPSLCERVVQMRTQHKQTQKHKDRQQKVQPVNWNMPLIDQVKQLQQKQKQQQQANTPTQTQAQPQPQSQPQPQPKSQPQTQAVKAQTQWSSGTNVAMTTQQKSEISSHTTPPATLSTINLSDLS